MLKDSILTASIGVSLCDICHWDVWVLILRRNMNILFASASDLSLNIQSLNFILCQGLGRSTFFIILLNAFVVRRL
jgi:hypothetical protein